MFHTTIIFRSLFYRNWFLYEQGISSDEIVSMDGKVVVIREANAVDYSSDNGIGDYTRTAIA